MFARFICCAVLVALAGSGASLWGQGGGFAYVVNQNSNNVSAYGIDAATGALSFIGNFAAGATPRWVAVDPSGQFVYVTNQGSGSVSGYTISAGTGTLTPISGSPFAVGNLPHGVTVHPSGQFAYITNCVTTFCFGSGGGSVSAYAIDAATGALTLIAGSPYTTGGGPASLAVDSSGQFAYTANRGANNVSAFMIDITTGALTPVSGSPFPAGGEPFSVTRHPTAPFVYVTNLATNNISGYMIDSMTGALAPIIGSPFQAGTSPVIFALDPLGQFAYAANCGSISSCGAPGTVSAYTVDATTGALTPVDGSPFTAGTGAFGVAVEPTGQFAYVTNFASNNVSAYMIDGVTGALAPIGNFSAGTNPVSIAVTAGPAPPPAIAAKK